LQTAYDRFNKELFGSQLPALLITLQRSNKRVRAYYSPDRFDGKAGEKTDELAMNPMHFRNRTSQEILSTLAHEMVHVWQTHHGKPGRRGYHNKQWAEKMKALGLQPSATGQVGGNETGEKMTHFVIPNSPFSRAATALETNGFSLIWSEPGSSESNQKSGPKKPTTRAKFSCPECDLGAWAKPTAKLKCGDCDTELEAC
jgi:hypothetical protein